MSDLNNPTSRIKDFFTCDNTGRFKHISNPYNILWIAQNHIEDSAFKEIFTQMGRLGIEKGYCPSINIQNYEKLFPKAKQEKILCELLPILVKEGGDLTREGIALARYGSVPVMKKAIELGVDINFQREGNYPLRTAYVRKKFKLANYLWSISEVDKTIIDKNQKSILHVMVDNKAFSQIFDLWENNRELFLSGFKNEDPTLLKCFLDYNHSFSDIGYKNKEKVMNIMIDLMAYCMENYPRQAEELKIYSNHVVVNEEIKDLWSMAFKKQLENKLDKKTTSQIFKI